MKIFPLTLVLFIIFPVSLMAQLNQPEPFSVSKIRVADNGDGTYKNPVLHADYSDPDVIRVGNDFYMTASSFNCVPGLPLLHSVDLVNWELTGYALPRLTPEKEFDKPQHGNGVWAPCIRYHNNEFYIFYPDPDHGIYMVKSKEFSGPWTDPVLVKAGKGLIDPSPLWDDDGSAYLVHAFAGSRAGIKSVLVVSRMSPDGTSLTGDEVVVFDGHYDNPTVEGPKFYKRNGYYYIFAPAGGVSTGWQLALRSKNVFGPYEEKVVLEQGSTSINGPHQGAWVKTAEEEDWFIHFRDMEANGRVVYLEPMHWENDWPVIGVDKDGNGIGEPVSSFMKPATKIKCPLLTPPVTDEFNTPSPGLKWQWHANPKLTWGFPTGYLGYYRLYCTPRPEEAHNLWQVPNLLLQKFPAEEFMATTKLSFDAHFDDEEIGLLVMGEDYQYISLKQVSGQLAVSVTNCENARTGGKEKEIYRHHFEGKTVYFRVTVNKGAFCKFSFSTDGHTFVIAGDSFQAVPGRWIGAKVGFFALRAGKVNDAGYADIDWFRVEKLF